MQKKIEIHPNYKTIGAELKSTISTFDSYEDILGDGDRNVIKVVGLGTKKYTIKSFKIPNFINQVVYRFFRKSKAERSYQYANKLLELGINTPFPVAYQIEGSSLLFKKSFYISELVSCDLTYRELSSNLDLPNHEDMLRAFTRFTHDLHKNGINFLDHSPGNTLIKKVGNDYEFYLVDLNRMNFGEMDFETRIKNFSKLTIHESIVRVMSNEYSKCTGEDENTIFNLMWAETQEFQERFYRKKRWKNRILFWRKK
ncbi:lipopolysaccharide kinase InaA family protein [Aquimarina pacifica]|uniref:lipopolysaccharide kinase InaA family protein n=1 Tax=Aquimarina pacifica TaxID=1296415 RepID=UPI00047138AD|nr:lipopolysaccharide kinase InaA family protein [Aquimarina pacifica]